MTHFQRPFLDFIAIQQCFILNIILLFYPVRFCEISHSGPVLFNENNTDDNEIVKLCINVHQRISDVRFVLQQYIFEWYLGILVWSW